ncbi:MAG: hypothetical protein SOT28_10515 [Fusicatenibacter sp.]|nr:hypothetical protein [Fusicatenibacter sp.]
MNLIRIEVKTLDKVEYQNRLEELNSLVKKEDYEGALQVVESVDWRRVKSVRTLTMVADVYEANKMYPEAKKILLMAYDRTTMGKGILYRLVEVAVKMKDFDGAVDYYNEFEEVARNDNSKYLLKYKILKGRKAPLEEQIEVLEEYRENEMTERWTYELALLYSKSEDVKKCVEICDELILWFSEGKYVTKAMELKMKYEPLTPSQQKKYDNREKPKAAKLSTVDEVSAALEEPEKPEEEEAREEKPEPSAAPTYLGSTIDLHAELAKSLRDVFRVKDPSKEEEAVGKPEEEPKAQEPEEYEVRDLEPEQLDVQVALAPDAGMTIKTRPEQKTKEQPASPAEEAYMQGYRDLDLEALFKETADNLSEELGTADSAAEADDTKAAAGIPAEETKEKDEDKRPVFQPIQDLEEEEDGFDLDIERLTAEIEGREIRQPEEPRKEVVTDATIHMGVEKTPDATISLPRTAKPAGDGKDEVVPMSVEEVLREETPEETRLRILNDTQANKLTEEQKMMFTYFAKVPGMDQQILDAMHGVYHHAGDRTSHRGNIAIMGGYGTGKTHLSESLVRAICADLKIPATKMARLDASDLNKKDPAEVVAKLAGGFLLIERAGLMYPETIEKLSRALDFRTDGLVLIIEDEKVSMRGMFNNYPEFAEKFETVISIPVFTNDELVTFARTYARENGCRMDEMGVLALYTQIGNNQKEGEPMTITQVKEMVDKAIAHAGKGTRRFGRKMSGRHTDSEDRVILYEKDFDF